MERKPDAPFIGPFSAAVVAGAAGLMIGIWQGGSQVEERYRTMMLYADLPPICEEALSDAADAYNETADAAQRQADDAPFIP